MANVDQSEWSCFALLKCLDGSISKAIFTVSQVPTTFLHIVLTTHLPIGLILFTSYLNSSATIIETLLKQVQFTENKCQHKMLLPARYFHQKGLSRKVALKKCILRLRHNESLLCRLCITFFTNSPMCFYLCSLSTVVSRQCQEHITATQTQRSLELRQQLPNIPESHQSGTNDDIKALLFFKNGPFSASFQSISVILKQFTELKLQTSGGFELGQKVSTLTT